MDLLASNLKKIRIEKGLSQEDLAEKIGSTRQYISNVENGKTLSLKMIDKIVEALGIEAAELFETDKYKGKMLKKYFGE